MVLHPSMPTAASAATSAMHIWDGLVYVNQSGLHKLDAILEAWGQGCLELTIELANDAVRCAKVCDTVNTAGFEFPGVYDYEVSCALGEWIAKQLLAKSDLPTTQERVEKLNDLSVWFFTQGDCDEESKANVRMMVAEALK